jgi:hypothetical protein
MGEPEGSPISRGLSVETGGQLRRSLLRLLLLLLTDADLELLELHFVPSLPV